MRLASLVQVLRSPVRDTDSAVKERFTPKRLRCGSRKGPALSAISSNCCASAQYSHRGGAA
jgi:hypothetical protein